MIADVPDPVPSFTPDDVDFGPGFLPFVATFAKAEVELTVALIVLACRHLGGWRAVSHEDIKAAVTRWTSTHAWLRPNPFLGPLFGLTVERGFAVWIQDEPEDRIALTQAAFARLVEKGLVWHVW